MKKSDKEIKEKIQSLYKEMKKIQKKIKTIRKECPHNKTEYGLYQHRIGHIESEKLCKSCGVLIPTQKNDNIVRSMHTSTIVPTE